MLLRSLRSLIILNDGKLYERPFELNIIGIRSKEVKPNRFDDELHVFYKVAPFRWEHHLFKITTDPGTYWLENPMQPKGTAILKQGQYIDAYSMGMHRGLYTALVQVKPVSVIRDYDRNAVLDFNNGKEEKGMFGINIHRASRSGTTVSVDRNSAGCQVFENASDFETFMRLCERHRKLYGNKFTYTLFDDRIKKRALLRRAGYYFGFFSLCGIGTLIHGKFKKEKTNE